MSSTYEKVLALLKKPAISREDFVIQPFLPWFRDKCELLRSIRTESLKDLIKNCRYERKYVDDIICKQGEVGDCCYIILGGKIGIYILNKDKDIDEEKNEVDVQFVYKDGKLDKSKLGNLAVILKAGVQVGEVALEEEGKARTASMISEDVTDLLVIDRDLYTRSVKDVLVQEKKKKSEFIQNNNLYRTWAPKYRQQLSMALYTKTFSYDSILVRQGDPVNIIYIILSGHVEIQIDPSLHPSQYSKIFYDANQNEAERLIRKVDKIRPPTEVHYSSHIKRRDNPKTMKLCYLGINECVGDVEVLMEQDTYMQTAVCKEKTEVLVLELKHFERLFVKRHPKTVERMIDQLYVKLKTRLSLLKNKNEVPLLSYLINKIDERNKPPQVVEKDRDFKDLTVAEAEKEFLNHKGPLIDIFGPGSVFQLIRVRKEKTKELLKHQRMKDIDRQQIQGGMQQLLKSRYQTNVAESAHGQRPSSAKSHDIKSNQSVYSPTPRADGGGYVQFLDDEEYDGNHSPEAMEYFEKKAEHDEERKLLEERIRDWLNVDNPKSGPQIATLKRLNLEHLDLQVKPGSKVMFRRKKTFSEQQAMNSETTNQSGEQDDYKVLITQR